MSKVYCKNCIHNGYYKTEFCQHRPECEYEEIGSEFSGSAKKKIRCQESIDRGIVFPAYKWELNKLGDCSNYKETKMYKKKKEIKRKKEEIKNFITKWLRRLKIKK